MSGTAGCTAVPRTRLSARLDGTLVLDDRGGLLGRQWGFDLPLSTDYTRRSFVARTAAWTRFRASSLRRISWMGDFTVFSLR